MYTIYLTGGEFHMDNHTLTGEQLILFTHQLRSEEREQSTIEKYIREIRFFQTWLTGRSVTAEIVARWKKLKFC